MFATCADTEVSVVSTNNSERSVYREENEQIMQIAE